MMCGHCCTEIRSSKNYLVDFNSGGGEKSDISDAKENGNTFAHANITSILATML